MRAIFMAVVLAAGLGILGASGASAAPANGAALATAAGTVARVGDAVATDHDACKRVGP